MARQQFCIKTDKNGFSWHVALHQNERPCLVGLAILFRPSLLLFFPFLCTCYLCLLGLDMLFGGVTRIGSTPCVLWVLIEYVVFRLFYVFFFFCFSFFILVRWRTSLTFSVLALFLLRFKIMTSPSFILSPFSFCFFRLLPSWYFFIYLNIYLYIYFWLQFLSSRFSLSLTFQDYVFACSIFFLLFLFFFPPRSVEMHPTWLFQMYFNFLITCIYFWFHLLSYFYYNLFLLLLVLFFVVLFPHPLFLFPLLHLLSLLFLSPPSLCSACFSTSSSFLSPIASSSSSSLRMHH